MKCRACDSQTEEILDLGEQTLPFGEKKYPLVLVKCPRCHLVQLRDTVPQELMYNDDYGYRSGINETIKADLKDIVEKALEFNPKTATDIGCNDGTLLEYYPSEVALKGYEPVKKLADEAQDRIGNRGPIIPTYFELGKALPFMSDIVTVISCFYDMPNPRKFVSDLKTILKPDGVIIVQQNYLKSMLENNAYDNICHEHLEYYSLLSLENLLSPHDLEVFRVEQNPINGGSFRTYITHTGIREIEPSVQQMRDEETDYGLDSKQPYADFVKRVHLRAHQLDNKLYDLFHDGNTIYAYGASTRGAVIMQHTGMGTQLIAAVVERNPDKIGKKYFGIPIISEEEAKNNPPDYKLIMPWFHQSIIDREKGDIPLILPLPEVKIV